MLILSDFELSHLNNRLTTTMANFNANQIFVLLFCLYLTRDECWLKWHNEFEWYADVE